MASRKKAAPRHRSSASESDENTLGRPVRSKDEADILQSIGAEEGEGGVLFVDEDRVAKELGGALDVESIRENQRLKDIAERQRNNEKGVPFNTQDPLVMYDTMLRHTTPDAILISVKRLSGTQVQTVIRSQPRTGADLYEALRSFHGNYGEAEYQVDFQDASRRTYRGRGRITMPDASHSQGASPMSAPQYPQQPQPPYSWMPQQPQQPQWQPPWQQAPPQQPQAQPQPQAQHPTPQAAPPQQAPAPAPTYVMPPPGPDPMQMMQQMFGIFTEMRNSLQQMQQPQAPPPPQMPPPPPAHADPATMMAWMQDMWRMFQTMQQPQAHATQAPVYQPPPPAATQPTPQDPLAMMGGMIEMFGKMSQIFNAQQSPQERRGPMRRPGVAGYPGRDGYPYGRDENDGYPQHYPPPSPQQPPPREKTAAEMFRESITVLKTAVGVYNELGALLPQPQVAPQYAIDTTGDDDDSPVRVVDTGAAKLAFDKKDGTLRTWESGLMNIDKVFNWLGEQREALQRAHEENRRDDRRSRRQLPPGYVEVTEGYRPPPGYVTVPVDPDDVPRGESDLPPPPDVMPPPIDQPIAASSRWGMPSIRGAEEE